MQDPPKPVRLEVPPEVGIQAKPGRKPPIGGGIGDGEGPVCQGKGQEGEQKVLPQDKGGDLAPGATHGSDEGVLPQSFANVALEEQEHGQGRNAC